MKKFFPIIVFVIAFILLGVWIFVTFFTQRNVTTAPENETTVSTFNPEFTEVDAETGAQIFKEEPKRRQKSWYLERDPVTHRQTLYFQAIEETGGAVTHSAVTSTPIAVTSFTRDLKEYQIIPNADNSLIGIIDNTGDASDFYLVNRAENTRENLFSYPVIENTVWLPNSKDFIFEARKENDPLNSLFVYRMTEAQMTELPFKASLQHMFIDQDQLIVFTNSNIQAGLLVDTAAESQLQSLNRQQSSWNVLGYSLADNYISFTKSAPFSKIDKIKMISDERAIYVLADEKIYRLSLG